MFVAFHRYWLVLGCVFTTAFVASPAFAEPAYEDLCEQGRQCLTKDDYAGAVRHYSAAIALNPNEELAFICRALAYQKTHDYDNAFKDCSQAITINAKAVPPYLIQGDMHQANNRMDEAIKAFTKAIDCDPRRSYSYVARGMAYRAIKKNEYAIADFKEGRKHDSKNVNAWLELAYTYRDMGKNARAIEAFDGAIACDDKYAASYFFRARLLLASNQIERTISDCKKAIELDKDDDKFAAAQGLLAAAYYAHQDYADAAKCFAKVADWVPVPVAYYWLGKSHLENKDFQAAVDAFTNAIKNKEDFVPAFFGRARTYEALDQKDKAEADKKTGTQLGNTPGVRHDDTATEVMDFVDMLHSKTKGLSPESLRAYLTKNDTKPSAVELAVESAREAADVSRQQAMAAKTLTTDIGPEVIAPIPTRKAQESFQRATALFQKHRYELASLHFHVMEVQYKEVLAEFEKRGRSDFGLWQAWASQKIAQLPSDNSSAIVYASLAFWRHQSGDANGYTQWMKKAVSRTKSHGIADPDNGLNTLLAIADIQEDCRDKEGALSSVLGAIAFCEGLSGEGHKSVSYARCAGYSARLGDLQAWNTCWSKAQEYASQVSRDSKYERQIQASLGASVAFAEASSLQKAKAAAEEMRTIKLEHGHEHGFLASAFARIALRAAMAGDDAVNRSMYEACATSVNVHLASFLGEYDAAANHARAILARADAYAGNCDRALVGAINIPSPEDRAQVISVILRKKVEAKNFDDACALAKMVPTSETGSQSFYWLAQAQALAGRQSMLQLRQWAERLSTPADRVLALAGIATAIKQAGTLPTQSQGRAIEPSDSVSSSQANDAAASLRKNRDNQQISDVFDRVAASSDWWIQEAGNHARAEQSPQLQGILWTHLGAIHAQKGDLVAAKSCYCRAKHCAMLMWQEVAAKQPTPQKDCKDDYVWRDSSQGNAARSVIAILDLLACLESIQRQTGDNNGALDTLQLVLKGAESLPKSPDYAPTVLPKDKPAWMARVAGRLAISGRQDLSEIVASGNSWCIQRSHWDKEYLSGIIAAEARNLEEVERWAVVFKNKVAKGTEKDSQYAASLYVLMATVAAENGDEEAYNRAAMTIGGLVNDRRHPASKKHFLGLARAAAIKGDGDVALDLVERAGGGQPDVLGAVAVQMAKNGQLAEAQKLSKQIQDDAANIPVWAALATAEAKASAGKLPGILQKIDSCPINAMKAASMLGVASALQKGKPNAADSQ
jgi:tetratricopeptide (TPR) repeat protein